MHMHLETGCLHCQRLLKHTPTAFWANHDTSLKQCSGEPHSSENTNPQTCRRWFCKVGYRSCNMKSWQNMSSVSTQKYTLPSLCIQMQKIYLQQCQIAKPLSNAGVQLYCKLKSIAHTVLPIKCSANVLLPPLCSPVMPTRKWLSTAVLSCAMQATACACSTIICSNRQA